MSTTKPKTEAPKSEAPKAAAAKAGPKLPIPISGEVCLVLRNNQRTKHVGASPNKAPGPLFVCAEHKPKKLDDKGELYGLSVVGLSDEARKAGWELVDVQ